MSNGILTDRQRQEQFVIETEIQETENQLNQLILEVKQNRKTVQDLVQFIESAVLASPYSVPVLCGRVTAEFPNNPELDTDIISNLIVNSYNVRTQRGDNTAARLRDNYLRMTGRKTSYSINNVQGEA